MDITKMNLHDIMVYAAIKVNGQVRVTDFDGDDVWKTSNPTIQNDGSVMTIVYRATVSNPDDGNPAHWDAYTYA